MYLIQGFRERLAVQIAPRLEQELRAAELVAKNNRLAEIETRARLLTQIDDHLDEIHKLERTIDALTQRVASLCAAAGQLAGLGAAHTGGLLDPQVDTLHKDVI